MFRVVNDSGVGFKTRILSEDGENFTDQLKIRKIDLHIEAEKIVLADIEAIMHCDIRAGKCNWVLPRDAEVGGDKAISSIRFTDGSVLDLTGEKPVMTSI